ncbi:hypothetical protein O181_059689 [Austropuccinia psidii MF-1]|uniref:Uncharacterized protein n=1 Tax=Austropuccinia psidii MF-1 TaxID=1389203 RepID=A0A9Q3EER9_9BASI|nr:hypothetical protein [Austropuccinia psidii MF-1]
MFFLAGLLNRSSLSFIFVTIIRAISIIALLFTLGIEIYLLVINIKGVQNASNHEAKDAAQGLNSRDRNSTNLSSEPLDSSQACGYISGTNVPTSFGGILFFVLTQLFNMLVLLLCLLSELAFPKIPQFFENFFPPLGPTFGVGILGALEAYISCILLSNHLHATALAAAWLLFVIGVINIFLGAIFGRRIRNKRSLLDAGTAYAKKATRVDEVESGFHLAQKGFFKGKKVFKNLRTSMIGRPTPTNEQIGSSTEMKSTRPPLDISRPMANYIQNRNIGDSPNQAYPPSPPGPAPPPPIYNTSKTVKILQGSRRKPSF